MRNFVLDAASASSFASVNELWDLIDLEAAAARATAQQADNLVPLAV